MSTLRFGYGTNGFTNHRIEDAIAVLADLGYEGIALTLDQPHLDPFAPDLARRTAALSNLLQARGFAVIVETGARYVLDAWRKHHPTLVSDDGRSRRIDYLRTAIDVAVDLGAEAVSFWSGILPDGVSQEEGWHRLTSTIEPVLEHARGRGVVCAFEPEPGMFADTLDDVLELRRRLGDPVELAVTLDIGHIVCNEPRGQVETVRAAGDLIANVQLDDMLPGVHEHLEFGTGDVDLPGVLAALVEVGYTGLASVELPRHAHAAPHVARDSLAALRQAAAAAPLTSGVVR